MATYYSYICFYSHKGLGLPNFLARKHEPKTTAHLLKRCLMQQNLLQQFSIKLWDKQEKWRFFTPLHTKIVTRQKWILKIEEYKKEVRAADCPVQPYPDAEFEWQQLPMDEQQNGHWDVEMVLREARHLPAPHEQLRGCAPSQLLKDLPFLHFSTRL